MGAAPTQAVILAGGKGTRLKPLTDRMPKPMVPMNGRPFVAYLVDMLVDQGITDIVFLLGYMAEQVEDYFGDGSGFGCSIQYSVSDVDHETGRRVKLVEDRLHDDFLLLYCDNYWPLPLAALQATKNRCGTEALVTVYANEDGFTKDNLIVNDAGLVEVYDKSRTTPGLSGVDIGFMLLQRHHIETFPEDNIPLESTLYPQLIARKGLAAYVSRHRYYSVGNLERLAETEAFLKFQPTVLLDRDGVLNRRMPKAQYVETWADWEWMPGALEALKQLKDAGYRAYVITNQAGIARGMMTRAQVDDIHAHMIEEAAAAGGRIDGIYMCPHHWDEGCDCRKPKPGMLFQAQREHQIDLSRTTYIGDDERDQQAAEAAGCHFIMTDDEFTLAQAVPRLLGSTSV